MLDDGTLKVQKAKTSVEHLQKFVTPYEDAVYEEGAIVERQRRAAEALKANQAVRKQLEAIKQRYTALVMSKDAQERGFELEKVMYEIFDLFDLDPRASFRNIGEQIDGAFALEGTEYLFEAKWQKEPVGVLGLDGFAAKVSRRLANTLGLFLSINGFSKDGIAAHSSGRLNIILADGADLMAVLDERIDLVSLLLRKKRHAAQTGNIFYRVDQIIE